MSQEIQVAPNSDQWNRDVVVQLLSPVWLFATPWIAAHQASLSFTISWSLLKFMSIESVMPLNHLIFCCPFSCLQSSLASGSSPVGQLFTSGGQSTGVSASASVLPKNIQDWFLLGLTHLIFLLCKECSRVFSNTTVQKHQLFGASLLYGPKLTSKYDYWKNHSFDYMELVSKVISLLFNTQSRFLIDLDLS